jgi:gluconolactonase
MSILSPATPVSAVLARPHGLLEAPLIGPAGEMIFSDVLAGGVWECSADGIVQELLPKRRGIGGIVEHEAGGWVLSGRDLVHLLPDGSQRVVFSDAEACGFNDLAGSHAGELLAGVLRYRPLAGEQPRDGQLLRIGREGAVEVITEDVIWPNGIGVAPDGSLIYMSDYAERAVLAISPDGGDVRQFCRSPNGSADGLAVDCEGGVWVALGEGGAVARFHSDGRLDEVISLPASFVSSISFGGEDMRDVLMSTADNHVQPELGGTLLRARSEVAGLRLQPVAV